MWQRRELVGRRHGAVGARGRCARGHARRRARGRERAGTRDQLEAAQTFDRGGATERGDEEGGDQRNHETAGAGKPAEARPPGTPVAGGPRSRHGARGSCCERGLEPGRKRRDPGRRQQIGQPAALASPSGVAPRPAPVAEALEPQLGPGRWCAGRHRADSTNHAHKAQPLHETTHAARARASDRPGHSTRPPRALRCHASRPRKVGDPAARHRPAAWRGLCSGWRERYTARSALRGAHGRLGRTGLLSKVAFQEQLGGL